MKEFVASIKEITITSAVSEEQKAQERERIEREGVGVIKVTLAAVGWQTTKESAITYAAAKEMGYTHFDCVEVERPKPKLSLEGYYSEVLPPGRAIRNSINPAPAMVRRTTRGQRLV